MADYISDNTHAVMANQAIRDQLAIDMARYLASGGKVGQYEPEVNKWGPQEIRKHEHIDRKPRNPMPIVQG